MWVALLCLAFVVWFFGDRFGRRASRGWNGKPSGKQINYIHSLIAQNNTFRSKDKCLDDWIGEKFSGKFSLSHASWLIGHLKEENSRMTQQLKVQINASKGKERRQLLQASDFRSYIFCPEAFRLSLNNFISRNLYDLEAGLKVHDRMASPSQLHRKQGVARSILSGCKGIRELVWSQSETKPFISKEWQMVGIPDALIHFENSDIGVLELKTRENVDQLIAPFIGEILQCVAYRFLISENYPVRDKVFLAYLDRRNSAQKLFEIDAGAYESDFRNAHRAMLNILNGASAETVPSLTKCRACGYRSVCKIKLLN